MRECSCKQVCVLPIFFLSVYARVRSRERAHTYTHTHSQKERAKMRSQFATMEQAHQEEKYRLKRIFQVVLYEMFVCVSTFDDDKNHHLLGRIVWPFKVPLAVICTGRCSSWYILCPHVSTLVGSCALVLDMSKNPYANVHTLVRARFHQCTLTHTYTGKHTLKADIGIGSLTPRKLPTA